MPDLPRPLAEDFEALIERWFFEAFHGSPVARSTEVWNTVFAAKDELKRRLAAFVAEASDGA